MVDSINLILIILSAVTLIMTVFLAILGTVAFFGWKSLKDVEKKQKALLVQKTKVLVEAESLIEESKKEIKKFTQELKDKTKTPAELEKQTQKTEELIEKLEKTVHKAENRIDNLRVSGITSTASILSTTPGLTTYSLIDDGKKCSRCGRIYYDNGLSSLSAITSRCPYCGEINY